MAASTSAFEPAPPGWSASAHGRRELLGIGVFTVLFALVPCCVTELYPFSRAPMFADAPKRYCEYRVEGPDGRELPLIDFGLQRNYWGNPLGVGVGFEPPASVDTFGQIASNKAVLEQVRERLSAFPELPFVDVTQHIVGSLDKRHIGVLAEERSRVTNPHHREPER